MGVFWGIPSLIVLFPRINWTLLHKTLDSVPQIIGLRPIHSKLGSIPKIIELGLNNNWTASSKALCIKNIEANYALVSRRTCHGIAALQIRNLESFRSAKVTDATFFGI